MEGQRLWGGGVMERRKGVKGGGCGRKELRWVSLDREGWRPGKGKKRRAGGGRN